MSDLWNPRATRQVLQNAGSFAGGGHKIVWHTTEGDSFPTYTPGTNPHFTLDPRNGALRQHVPLNLASMSLQHPSGPETNRANAIQVELIGHAADTDDWSDAEYDHVRNLARWIEDNFNVRRHTQVDFRPSGQAHRLSGDAFYAYQGHIGHEHVPGNDHTDPGAFRIQKVLARQDGR